MATWARAGNSRRDEQGQSHIQRGKVGFPKEGSKNPTEIDPLPGRGGRGAGAEQRQRLGAAGPGRGQVVPGQRVGEPEQQLGLGGEEAPAAAPGGPRPRARSPALAFVSPPQAERRPQPARDAFQKPRDYFAEGTCGPGQPPLAGPAALGAWALAAQGSCRPRGGALLSAPFGRSRPGARVGGARVPASRLGSPAAALSRGSGPHPPLRLARSEKAPGRRVL